MIEATRSSPDTSPERPLRILAVAETWQGATDYGFVRAFRRAGHSVLACPADRFFPSGWKSTLLRGIRRALLPLAVRDYNADIVARAGQFRPDLFFAFKGASVTAETLWTLRAAGIVAINVYPDVSMTLHGPHIVEAISQYDWVFTTKSYGLGDLERVAGMKAASFMEHGFDIETHRPMTLDERDLALYGCDASFIGTWSLKKEQMLSRLIDLLPDRKFRVWGHFWENAKAPLGDAVMHDAVLGDEYSKAICASKVNIAIMSEVRSGSSSGDLTTTRTFEIPACGGFMLHERNDEVRQFFEDGRDCAMFGDADELSNKVAYYLDRPAEREAIAAAGLARSLACGYSTDDHAAKVVAKCREFMAVRANTKEVR